MIVLKLKTLKEWIWHIENKETVMAMAKLNTLVRETWQ